MKILSIAIPCYNSAGLYEPNASSPCCQAADDIEILVVDDGSTKTIPQRSQMTMKKNIRGSYRRSIRRTADMERQSMPALRNATGVYYKVVDSDDWVDCGCSISTLSENFERSWWQVRRLLICSSAILSTTRQVRTHKKVMRYRTGMPQRMKYLPVDHAKCGLCYIGHYILMHSVIYRTNAATGVRPGTCQSIPFTWTICLCSSRFRM